VSLGIFDKWAKTEDSMLRNCFLKTFFAPTSVMILIAAAV
jgi:hypothetical protein